VLAVAVCIFYPATAMDQADEDHLLGQMASFTLARVYWSVSIFSCGTSLILLTILAIQWCRDQVFSEWPLQIYIPLLLSDFVFSFTYFSHHIFNMSYFSETNHSPSNMVETFSCKAAWIGMVVVSMRHVGFTALGWAPWYAIRCSKDFKHSNMPRAILAWTFASIATALAVTIPVIFITGTKSTAGLYCPSMGEEPWNIAIFQLSLPVICYTAFGIFSILAHIECEHLSKTAQVDSVRRVARESRNLALVALAVCMFFNAPYVISIIGFFVGLGDDIPSGFIAYSGMFVKFGSWGTVILVRHHAATLRKRARVHKELCLDFTEGALPAGEVEDITPLENRGVSLPFLVSFVRQHLIGSNTSTEDVMQQYVKPESRSRKCCYVELVKTWTNADGVRAVKKPQYFVSHCWADAFCSLLEQLVIFTEREERTVKGPFHFWVDIFAINQHDVAAATELPMIPRVIQNSQAVLFTLNPWFEPKTLQRVWCLWELLQAVKSDVKVRPTMPESEELNFLDTISQDRSKIVKMLDTVDVQHANATVLSDKETIFSEISTTMGFDAMNSMVKTNLRRCLQGVAIDRFFGFAGSIAGLHSAFESGTSADERLHVRIDDLIQCSSALPEAIPRSSKFQEDLTIEASGTTCC